MRDSSSASECGRAVPEVSREPRVRESYSDAVSRANVVHVVSEPEMVTAMADPVGSASARRALERW
jgi:hypothetical protein